MLNWIRQAGGCIEGEDGHAFAEELTPDPDEIVVRGSGLSAYGDSSFAEVLDKLEVETLLVAGITTHWAVEGTVRIAADSGLNCVVVANFVASAVVENHESALERLGFIAHISTAENVIEILSEA